MEFKDYYRVLGIPRDADQDAVKRAYRRLARKYHPDVSKEANAKARFQEVGEAYEVLKDPDKRTAYDRFGKDWKAGQEFTPPPGWEPRANFKFNEGGLGEFSDFFEALFGRQRRHSHGDLRGNARGRGEDQHARITIGLDEAFAGSSQTVKLRIPESDGRGAFHQREKTLAVKIPKGVVEGQQIRLAGQGAPGIGGGPPGDLYLEIGLRPHSKFRASGRDVYIDLPVAPWETALGEAVKVPTLGGEVDLRIPKGSQSGKTLRLKGRGLPGEPPGDQYVILQIFTPPADTTEAEELYRDMAKRLRFDARARIRS